MKENKTKMKAIGEDNSRSWAWIIFILIVFFVSLAFAVKPSNETSSYFEATGDMTGQIKVKGVQLKIYQDTGEGYKDVTKDGFDLDTNYFVTDRSYNYDMIIKNDDKATVKAEEYYLRWWFSANIDGTEYDITDYCSVDTAFVYKQDDSDGKTRFYSVNGYNSNVISAQTQLTFLSNINFKGQYDSSTGSYGSILDKEASGSKIKITAHIEGSLEPYDIIDPTVKFYDADGSVFYEKKLEGETEMITPQNLPTASIEHDGETLYFQGWIKNGVVSTAYLPNEEVEVEESDVFTPYYAKDAEYPDFTFTIDDVTGDFMIAGANSSMTSAEIPTLYQGQFVSVVKGQAFYQYSSLQAVELPQTITRIGDQAFMYCSKLTSITIPDTVTSMGAAVFRGCSSLTSITIPDSVTSIGTVTFRDCSSLTEVKLPSGLTSISNSMFYGCSNLTSLVIPENVTSIAMYAFYNCTKLSSINIPNNVSSIGPYAFYFCSSLTSIDIPSKVTSIGESAFQGCSSMTSINVSSNNASFCSKDGVLFDKSATTLIVCPGAKSGAYTIPTGVKTITSSAFYYCTKLTSITISSSVTTIDSWAFAVCSGITSLTIPNSVTKIGNKFISGCGRLTSITFENTSNWYITTSSDYSNGSAFDVTNPTNNATNLKGSTYQDCYLYR